MVVFEFNLCTKEFLIMNQLYLGQFLSMYLQEFCVNFMVYLGLCFSFEIKTSKTKAYVLAFLCSNFIPFVDTFGVISIGGGTIPFTLTVDIILRMCNVIGSLLILFFVSYTFRMSWYKIYWWPIITLLILTFIDIVVCLNNLIRVDEHQLARIETVNFSNLPEYLISLLIVILVGIFFIYVGKLINRAKALNTINRWTFFAFYFIFLLMNLLMGKSYGDPTTQADDANVYDQNYILLIFFFISILVITISFLMSRSDKKLLRTENSMLRQQNELQYQNYLMMQQQEIEIRKIYHDIGNHIGTISLLVQNDEGKEAKAYLNNLVHHYQDIKRSHYCSNKIMNAVLMQKLSVCDQNDIDYELDIRIPENLVIKDIDLMSLFTNLLDNAIEACRKNSNKNNKITIMTGVFGDYFTVKVLNSKSAHEVALKKGNEFTTSKKDKAAHGYGIKIIKDIIERHEGKYEFIDQGNEFSSMVMLKNRQPQM